MSCLGVSYEDSVRFWKEEFCKKMDGDAFDKNHLYDIKHAYGKVGRMLNYSGYSCLKIIMSNVGPGESHGCPFKHWDSAVLRSKLNEYGISEESKEISFGLTADLTVENHFTFYDCRVPINLLKYFVIW